MKKAESENNQQVENQPTDKSGEKTPNNESSPSELEGNFALVPLTEDQLKEGKVAGEGGIFFNEDGIYAIGYGSLLISIGGESVWLGEEWRGQPTKWESINKGFLNDATPVVDLVVTVGNKVSAIEVFQRFEVWDEEKNNY